MPEEMTCFACEQEPTQQCPRCGRPYCDDHGEDVCDACLEPASGLPSFTLYRGSLLVLLIGTALAVWFILQPPGDNNTSAASPLVITPTQPVVVLPTATLPAVVPGLTSTPPGAAQTPAVTPTVPAAPTQATGGTTSYVVQAGDTLSAICAELSSLDPTDCIDKVLQLNAITDPGAIVVGETLAIPQ
jgi:hypothetical protein